MDVPGPPLRPPRATANHIASPRPPQPWPGCCCDAWRVICVRAVDAWTSRRAAAGRGVRFRSPAHLPSADPGGSVVYGHSRGLAGIVGRSCGGVLSSECCLANSLRSRPKLVVHGREQVLQGRDLAELPSGSGGHRLSIIASDLHRHDNPADHLPGMQEVTRPIPGESSAPPYLLICTSALRSGRPHIRANNKAALQDCSNLVPGTGKWS